jgi:triacylglycerol lipase
VLCTGHSLGGALATLCGIWAKTMWPFTRVRVITAGSPRMGNAPFTQHFESLIDESWRVINGADVIPTLPLPPVPE